MTRPVYRKWSNDGSDFFLKIAESGDMLQIRIEQTEYHISAEISQTTSRNPINVDVIRKHKEVASKHEWQKALEKVKFIMRGEGRIFLEKTSVV